MPLNLPPTTDIEPLEDQIFCRMYAPTGQWKQDSKIMIPQSAREEVFFAHVLKVGPGKTIDVLTNGARERMTPQINVGDDILFFRYHGERIMIEGELYLILAAGDVLARIHMPEESRGVFFRFAKVGDDNDALAEAKVR
jgi:chaperonin GroES